MKKTIIICIAAFQLLSCNSKKSQEEDNTVSIDSVSTNNEIDPIRVFEGTLPCADCNGIQTVLKVNIVDNKFELTSIYEGKSPEKKIVEKGNLNTEKGLDKDKDGTIYILNWDKPQTEQIYYGYYSNNPEKLYRLDRDKKIIKSQLHYFLELNE